jgi:hypothetical protein
MNQILGCQILPGGNPLNDVEFKGTYSVIPLSNHYLKIAQIKLFAEPHSRVLSGYSEQHQSYSYVWGIPAHPKVAMPDIPGWCAKVAAEKRYELFRELVGTFVVIIDEPCQQRITFVTDILGIRPMFFGKYRGRLVFGSNVWQIYKEGLSSGKINYDAVSSWIAYGYNCTDGSLFSDLKRMPPGAAVIFQEGQYTEFSYTKYDPTLETPSAEQISKDLYDIVSSTVKTLLADYQHVSLSLSGGFDSRFLLSLIVSLGSTSVDCATVNYNEAEGQIASEVAKTLKVPHKTIHVSSSEWDLYEQVYHSTPDGFPITKNVNYCVAERFPDIPMVNGFMGDRIRGVGDTVMGKYEEEWNSNLADVLQQRHLHACLKMFRKDIAELIKMRSRVPMEDAVRKGSDIGRVFQWANYYYRQRQYISNNFLQHIGITEALLPFYSWELLSYKMNHDCRLFGRDIYNRIFKNYSPSLAHIPHAGDLPLKKKHLFRVARCTKQWARELFPVLCNKNWLSLLQRENGMIRNMAGIAGLRKAEPSVFLMERLYLLEKKARESGLDFDWDGI